MLYAVFAPNGTLIFPSSGGSGVLSLDVNQGETVLLSLYFSGDNVVMYARDWATGSITWQAYSRAGATIFAGSKSTGNSVGFFTGLMTEEYHSSPFFGREEKVVYQTTLAVSSATMWIDEYNAVTKDSLFFDRTGSPLLYSVPTEFHFFSSHDTAEASNAYQFITGLSVVSPIMSVSYEGTPYTWGSMFWSVDLKNTTPTFAIVNQVTVVTDFGSFHSSLMPPLNLTAGQDWKFNETINIPLLTYVGNHTFTTVVSWRFYQAEILQWVIFDLVNRSSVGVQQNPLISFLLQPAGIISALFLVAIVAGLAHAVTRRLKMKTAGRTPKPLIGQRWLPSSNPSNGSTQMPQRFKLF